MKSGCRAVFDKIVKILGSLRLSFVLLILLGILVAQKAIVAQKVVASQYGKDVPLFLRVLNALGIDSPGGLGTPFLIVLVFFVLNLGISSFRMAERVNAKQKSARSFRSEEALGALPNAITFNVNAAQNSKTLITQFFKRHNFSVNSEDLASEARIYAVKHGAGYWGVLCFHLTFLVVLIGALLSILTRFTGYTELSPGDVFVEKRSSYLISSGPPKLFGKERGFTLRLDKIDLSYWMPGEAKTRASVVSVFDSKGNFTGKERIEVNSPLKISGMSIYQGARGGFIAGLDVTDSVGTRAVGTIRFRIPEKYGETMVSRVNLPGTALTLELELFTEKIGDIEGLEQLGSMAMVTLIKVTSIDERQRVFKGVVFGGGTLSFEGLTLGFVSLKPYTSFIVVQDYGVPAIFTGFGFLILGLLITYFWVPENCWVVIKREKDCEVIVIGATTERYKESFKERFASQMEELKAEMVMP